MADRQAIERTLGSHGMSRREVKEKSPTVGVDPRELEHRQGYRAISGGWVNSTARNPDTVDRKNRVDGGLASGGYDSPDDREERARAGRAGRVLTNDDL